VSRLRALRRDYMIDWMQVRLIAGIVAGR